MIQFLADTIHELLQIIADALLWMMVAPKVIALRPKFLRENPWFVSGPSIAIVAVARLYGRET